MAYRKIIHIDMDAFFVSVEEHDNPALKGHPVVVGYDGPRGVVATANYIARKYGIHSALPVATAHRLCPDLIVVEGRYERYKEISRQVHSIFHEYTDIIEPLSLDEAYLDVTANKKGMTLAVDIAREIKQRILEETGLTASAGVSYCKFLAKIASEYRKPNGLCTVHPDRALDFIDGLKVEQLWGVGEKTAQRMHALSVFTGKELRDVPLTTLTRVRQDGQGVLRLRARHRPSPRRDRMGAQIGRLRTHFRRGLNDVRRHVGGAHAFSFGTGPQTGKEQLQRAFARAEGEIQRLPANDTQLHRQCSYRVDGRDTAHSQCSAGGR